MKAIRGAITIELDQSDVIRRNVKELLLAMKEQNKIEEENIIFIMFSNTNDIHSFYPAKAAREAGFTLPALFSAVEPDIDGSLPLCIRVIMLVENMQEVHHVYLKGAKVLRKDITKSFNIALDGPAGSGKSTVSKLIAKKLNILYLDTGAMYRACALKAVQSHIDVTDQAAVEKLAKDIQLDVRYENGMQVTILDGCDVGDSIRTPEVSMLASTISANSAIRTAMVEMQRKIASKMSCILDGRDIGTNVLPNAEFKFFLTAKAEVRAKRRYDENIAKGYKSNYEQILEDIKQRDYQDENRAIAPLRPAKDAVMVDTSDMSINEVVEFIIQKVQERV